MTARVQVPEGCRQVEFEDGTVSRIAKDGAGMVEVSDRQALHLRRRNLHGIKVIADVQVGLSHTHGWVECAKCPRSTLDSNEYRDSGNLCPRCRG